MKTSPTMSTTRRPLRIAFLDFDSVRNPLLNGGQARATFEVARRLVRRGHHVTVICSRFPGCEDGYIEGIFYRHIGLGSSSVRANNVVFFFALPRVVHSLDVDIVIESFLAPISTCFSPLFTAVPVIGMPTMFEAREFARKYHLPFHWIEAFGCTFYRYFLAYSLATKAKMESLNPTVVTRVIPNGVDDSLLTYPTTRGNYAVYIGRIDLTQKGLDLLLAACCLLKDRGVFLHLVIAGNGPVHEEQALLAMISDLQLGDRVSWIGRVDGQRKIDLLAHSLFGVYPSRFEDFPLVPLEFAVLGKPLAVFDIPGLAWVPSTIALKAPAFNVQTLTDNLAVLATDRACWEACSAAARLFARRYSWGSIAPQYEEFCYDIVVHEGGTL